MRLLRRTAGLSLPDIAGDEYFPDDITTRTVRLVKKVNYSKLEALLAKIK